MSLVRKLLIVATPARRLLAVAARRLLAAISENARPVVPQLPAQLVAPANSSPSGLSIKPDERSLPPASVRLARNPRSIRRRWRDVVPEVVYVEQTLGLYD